MSQLKQTRDTAVAALRNRLGGTIEELGRLMDDDDPRWYAFGLNRPADPETPGIPDGLTAHAGAGGSGTAYLDWADARRAERYRVWRQIFSRLQTCASFPTCSLAKSIIVRIQ